ncbi:RluA family pseudouridine synthase [Elusimicrobiota bacterium]
MIKKITAKSSEERLDIYLSRIYSDYSRSYFQRLAKSGNISVNGRIKAPSYLVKENDQIQIDFITQETKLISEKKPLDIVYEDKDIIVVNKKPGIVVHPACGHPKGTLLNALIGYAERKYKPFLVHRLDKDTSGVIIVAKNELSKNSLIKQFQNRTIKKLYLTLVSGHIEESKGRIEAPLGRSLKDRKKIAVGPAAKKMSITEFKVVSRKDGFSLLEVNPLTGRTHQIRTHMAYIGHPVLGDQTYGGPVKLGNNIFNRQMLHAYKIRIQHPTKHKSAEFAAKPPKDFKDFWY